MTMAVPKTRLGVQIRWYDVDGRERKLTIKGIKREEAKEREREILAERDRGEARPDVRKAPAFQTFAEGWVEEFRSRWKAFTLSQYQQARTSSRCISTRGRRLARAGGPRQVSRRTRPRRERGPPGELSRFRSMWYSPYRVQWKILRKHSKNSIR